MFDLSNSQCFSSVSVKVLKSSESESVGEVYVGLGAAVVLDGVTPDWSHVDLPLTVRRAHRVDLRRAALGLQVQGVTAVRP